MNAKTRWLVCVIVWGIIFIGATVATHYRGGGSLRSFVECSLYASLALEVFGFIYFAGGAIGDAFPPYTVVDQRASQGQRGQPLDHDRGLLPKLTLGPVVMVAAAIPAIISGAVFFLLQR